jgi:hypothetical protein
MRKSAFAPVLYTREGGENPESGEPAAAGVAMTHRRETARRTLPKLFLSASTRSVRRILIHAPTMADFVDCQLNLNARACLRERDRQGRAAEDVVCAFAPLRPRGASHARDAPRPGTPSACVHSAHYPPHAGLAHCHTPRTSWRASVSSLRACRRCSAAQDSCGSGTPGQSSRSTSASANGSTSAPTTSSALRA